MMLRRNGNEMWCVSIGGYMDVLVHRGFGLLSPPEMMLTPTPPGDFFSRNFPGMKMSRGVSVALPIFCFAKIGQVIRHSY